MRHRVQRCESRLESTSRIQGRQVVLESLWCQGRDDVLRRKVHGLSEWKVSHHEREESLGREHG